MKKKVKVLAMMLGCLGLVMMALSCGSTESRETKEIVTSSKESLKQESSDTESELQEENPEQEEQEEAAEIEEKTDGSDITIEEQTLLEEAGIVITAKEYVSDDLWGDGIKLLLENNSEKTVTVSCHALIVNNYMITDLFAAEVAAGKKSNEIMYLSSMELKAAGIETVGQIEVYFHIYDSATFEEIYDSPCVTIETSEFSNMDTTPDDLGTELYNENGIRIVGKTVDEDSFWGTAILLYSENTSGKNVSISVDEMSVNGFMMSPLFSTTVYDGKMSFDEITIFSNELETNGIEEIEEVELKFQIYDADSFSTIAESETITFSAQ